MPKLIKTDIATKQSDSRSQLTRLPRRLSPSRNDFPNRHCERRKERSNLYNDYRTPTSRLRDGQAQ